MNPLAIAVFFVSSAVYLYLMSALGKRLRRCGEESSVSLVTLPVRAPSNDRQTGTPLRPLDVPAADVISA